MAKQIRDAVRKKERELSELSAETETGGSTEHSLFFSYNTMTGAESDNKIFERKA